MSILFELIFEFVFEIVFELVFEAIFYFYMRVISKIMPRHVVTKAKKVIKCIVGIYLIALIILVVTGLALSFSEDASLHAPGRIIMWVSLALIVLQLVVGIALKIIELIKKRK